MSQAPRDSAGRFSAGMSGNPAGRPRGAADNLTTELRNMIREALEAEGGVEYLRRCARVGVQPRELCCGALATSFPSV